MEEDTVVPEGPQNFFYICKASWRYRTEPNSGPNKPRSGYEIYCPKKEWVENNDPITHLHALKKPVDLNELAEMIYHNKLKDYMDLSDSRMDDVILPNLKWGDHYLILNEVPPGYVEGVGPDHCGDFLQYIRSLTPDEQDTFWDAIYNAEYIPEEDED
jgi:hypothetical protein